MFIAKGVTMGRPAKNSVIDAVADQVAEAMNGADDEYNDASYKDDDIVIDNNTVYVPSGSKMLDIACSDNWKGAFVPGRYVNLIGDSSAGKSILALSMLAELTRIPAFDNYRFIYDDAEEANSFDVKALFGQKLYDRIEPPNTQELVVESTGEVINAPKNSSTIQEFQLHVFDAIEHKSGKPFIYILDSFDSISSKAEIETAQANMTALRKGTKESGSYGMDKPKIVGQILRMIVSKLKQTQSFLLIVSQTRDDINPMTFTKKTRSGGNALKFYASHEIWLAVLGKIKKTALGHERIIGVDVRAKITKNKLTGKIREIDFPIYYSYGIDDIGACFDFIMSTNHWEMNKKTILATEFDITGTRDTIIKHIETQNKEEELFAIANKRWLMIEDAVAVKRKSKF